MEKIKTISASSINTYSVCPLQWYFNYMLKLVQLPNPAFLVGTAYHKALELFHLGRNDEQIKDEVKKLLVSDIKDKEQIERYALVALMFRKYKESPVLGDIVSAEFQFSQPVSLLEVPLFGYIDRVDTDKIVEYKTSSYDYTRKDIESLQSKIYTYVVWKQKGKILPVCYSVNNKKKAKNKDYKVQQMTIEYKETDMIQLEAKLREFYLLVTKEKDFNYKQGTHCRWCAYGDHGTRNCKYSI